MPQRRNMVVRVIRGNPVNAVGSSLSIFSSKTMPSASFFALPAQSYGSSIFRYAESSSSGRLRKTTVVFTISFCIVSSGFLSCPFRTQRAVWKITFFPRIFFSCSRAFSNEPGFPICSPSHSATWSEPMTIASGNCFPTVKASQSQTCFARCFVRQGGFIDIRTARDERQTKPGKQFLAVL